MLLGRPTGKGEAISKSPLFRGESRALGSATSLGGREGEDIKAGLKKQERAKHLKIKVMDWSKFIPAKREMHA